MRSKRSLGIAGLAAIAAGAVMAASRSDTGPPPPIEVDSCLVSAHRDVAVSARIDGELTPLPDSAKVKRIEEGMRVEAGQLLAQLVDTQAAILVQIQEAEANNNAPVEAAQLRFDEQRFTHIGNKTLFDKEAIPEFEFKKSEIRLALTKVLIRDAEFKVQKAKLTAGVARARLTDHQVRAPIAGVIVEKGKEVGEAVKAREPIFRILDTRTVYVEGWLPIRYLRQVRLGQKVTVHLEIEPERAYPGTIAFVATEVDASSNTFRVKAKVPNPDGSIQPKLRAKMIIDPTSE